MKAISVIFLILLSTVLNGCLIFHKISYDIKLKGKGGTAEVVFYDLRSNAEDPSEFEEDKDYLFNYIWKSPDFLDTMRYEGKEITERNLFLSNDTLVGKIVFSFKSINSVENIILEDGFYYLTLPLEDSVISTNGEIIESSEYKRILWDSSYDRLQFEILGYSFDEEKYRPLGYHFKSLR